jgi:hypothetical protein
MDIGYGDGTSPGGSNYCLFLTDFTTRHNFFYGLKSKSGQAIVDALWCFFIDAGGIPARLRCDFDPSFVHGEVETFLQRQNIKITSSPPHRKSQNGAVERQW